MTEEELEKLIEKYVDEYAKVFGIKDEIEMPTEPKFDYLKESERTASSSFYGNLINYRYFYEKLIKFAEAAADLDRYKKLIFYGEDKTKNRLNDFVTVFDKDGDDLIIKLACANNEKSIEKSKHILHALLGVMTEAGELAEALEIAFRTGFDHVNLLEESGDIKWYLAMLARALGNEWDADEKRNIEKLRKRFPEKFTETHANERDLVGEREILEAGHLAAMDSRDN